jgi:putative transposase
LEKMNNHSSEFDRHSLRIKDYDYTQTGAYFITVCTYNRECILGSISHCEVILNKYGRFVQEEWLRTGRIRNGITLDTFVVMPNHFHGIIIFNDDKGTKHRAPTAFD